jgi:hypothetical protein
MKLLSAILLFIFPLVANAHHEELVSAQLVHDLFHLVTNMSIVILPVILMLVIIKLAYKG